MAQVLILTAVTMEARAVRRAGLPATVIGIGAGRLARIAVPKGTAHVVMAGVGGAVDPSLAVGDVVTDAFVARASRPCLGGQHGRDAHATVGRAVRHGTIHSVGRVVSTAAEKAAIFVATGAAVVDMEQAIVRQWAERLGLPVIGVRAVSDAATDAVDPAVVRFVTDVGRPRPGVIAMALLRRPGLIPQLWRLNAHTGVALRQLAAVLPAVVRSFECSQPGPAGRR
jgi:adenosylhomocysteine nucleosidase